MKLHHFKHDKLVMNLHDHQLTAWAPPLKSLAVAASSCSAQGQKRPVQLRSALPWINVEEGGWFQGTGNPQGGGNLWW